MKKISLTYYIHSTVSISFKSNWRVVVNTERLKNCRNGRSLLGRPIKRIIEATLLGIDITSTLSTSVYVNRMLMQIDQRLYLLSQLKSQGMNVQAL